MSHGMPPGGGSFEALASITPSMDPLPPKSVGSCRPGAIFLIIKSTGCPFFGPHLLPHLVRCACCSPEPWERCFGAFREDLPVSSCWPLASAGTIFVTLAFGGGTYHDSLASTVDVRPDT